MLVGRISDRPYCLESNKQNTLTQRKPLCSAALSCHQLWVYYSIWAYLCQGILEGFGNICEIFLSDVGIPGHTLSDVWTFGILDCVNSMVKIKGTSKLILNPICNLRTLQLYLTCPISFFCRPHSCVACSFFYRTTVPTFIYFASITWLILTPGTRIWIFVFTNFTMWIVSVIFHTCIVAEILVLSSRI